MSAKPKANDSDKSVRMLDRAAAMNQKLLLAVVRQHELTEEADKLNEELKAEIQERREVEKALRESEERYRLLFMNMLDAFAYCKMHYDDNGRPVDFEYIEVNDVFRALTGLEDVVGRKVTEVIPGVLESNPEMFETFGRVALGGDSEKFEVEVKPLGMWFSVSAFSARDGHFVAVFDNITERKIVESVVRARLRLSESSDEMSLDGILQKTLDEIEALTQSTIGFYHFLQPDQKTISLACWSTNTLDNMCTAEGRGRSYPVHEAGVWVDCLRERRPIIYNDYASIPHRKGMPEGHAPVTRGMFIPVIRGERVVAIIGVGNKPSSYNDTDVEIASTMVDLSWDIVERKRVADALGASELRYRQIFASANDGILLLEADEGKIYDVNPCMADMLGCPREEVVGKTAWDIGLAKDSDAAKNAFRKLLEDGQSRYENLPLATRDGRSVDVEVVCGLYEVDGAKFIQCNFRDITDKKKLERMRTDFISMLTHDLRSPLTTIRGYTDMLLASRKEIGPDKADMVEVIGRSSDKIMTMIGDFLTVLKLENNVMQVFLTPDNVSRLCEKVAADFIPAANNKGVRLETDLSRVPMTGVDAKYLERAVGNLIQNAINYTQSGGKVVLKVESGNRGNGSRKGPYLDISVIDTGPGIPEEDRGRVFDKYFTKPVTKGGAGTGLGLAIVKAVAEAHGGWAEVESEMGKGSSFHIYIPVKPVT